jgi:hypothetical protein
MDLSRDRQIEEEDYGNSLTTVMWYACCGAAGQYWGGIFFGVRSEDQLLGKCGVFSSVRSEAVTKTHHITQLHFVCLSLCESDGCGPYRNCHLPPQRGFVRFKTTYIFGKIG